MEKPRSLHLKKTKRILCFVKGTASYILFYSSLQNLEITGYSDSDWAENLENKKSTTKFIFFYSRNNFHVDIKETIYFCIIHM
jgi:hypothetical protein